MTAQDFYVEKQKSRSKNLERRWTTNDAHVAIAKIYDSPEGAFFRRHVNAARSLKIEKEFLTTTEAAEYLGISEHALICQTSNGKIPYYKFQRRNRYLLKELRELLLSQKRGNRKWE